MKIGESKPFKQHLSSCEKLFGKGKMGGVNTIKPISAETIEKHAQEIYNGLTGCGLTYNDTVLIREIVWEQLKIDKENKPL